MPRLETFPLSAWIRYFGNFGSRSLERWQEAIERLEEEKYSPEKFMTDMALTWADLANGWWTAIRQTAGGPVPTVFLKILSDDQVAAEGDIALDSSAEGTVEMTEPVLLGGSSASSRPSGKPPAGQPITGRHVRPEPHPGKASCLRIVVHRILPPEGRKGASNAKGEASAQTLASTPPFTPGIYQSLLHQNGKLLATVVMLVVESSLPKDDLSLSG